MSIFDAVKGAVSTREAAVAYGLSVTRSGMVCCPFHGERHPSMKVDRRYYCFACHETGDVISFTARLFDLPPYQAAKKLAADFGVREDAPPRFIQPKPPDKQCIGAILELLRLLRRWKKLAPQTPGEVPDDRFITACQCLPSVEALADGYLEGSEKVRKEITKKLTESGNLTRLTSFLARQKEETA